MRLFDPGTSPTCIFVKISKIFKFKIYLLLLFLRHGRNPRNSNMYQNIVDVGQSVCVPGGGGGGGGRGIKSQLNLRQCI